MKTPARQPFSDTYPELGGHALVVDGYGINIRVERGHLHITDGHGRQRRERRIPRIGHNVRRLIVIGHTGSISLEALRWLDRTRIQFTQLDTDGHLLAASANLGIDDARLRRAQHVAYDQPAGVEIARYLIDTKIAGQADVARKHLDAQLADTLDRHRDRLSAATRTVEILTIEAQAAYAYWAGWGDTVTITWATKDHDRVPDHWHHLGTRRSPLTGTGTRRAVNPINALLNYLYALAEIECRNACLTLGLDPGLGYLHTDKDARDSLALDLIEAIRPDVDDFALDLLQHHTFRADDFTEHDDGHCRINPPLTHQLAATLLDWQLTIAPHAHHTRDLIAQISPRRIDQSRSVTRGTKQPKNRADRSRVHDLVGRACRDCGAALAPTATLYCPDCLPARRAMQRRTGVAAAAAMLTNENARRERGRRVSEGRHAAKLRSAADYGLTIADWEHVAPRVADLTLAQIMDATHLSVTQASKIKTGKSLPHPRHWKSLINSCDEAASLEGDLRQE